MTRVLTRSEEAPRKAFAPPRLRYGEQETFSAWLRVVYDGICASDKMTSGGLAHERKRSEDAQTALPSLEVPRAFVLSKVWEPTGESQIPWPRAGHKVQSSRERILDVNCRLRPDQVSSMQGSDRARD
jgi:hypothetical protein